MKQDAAKMVSSALLGRDGVKITVGGKEYEILPPTIKRMVGAGYYLSDFGNETSTKDIMQTLSEYRKLTKALSWYIQGDESLAEELSAGTLEEVVNGLETAFRQIGLENFTRLLTLVRSVKRAIAKQR